MSVYPQLTVGHATRAVRDGLPGTEFLLPFQLQKAFGSVLVSAELGYSFEERGDGTWIYGVAVGCSLGHRLEAAFELHGGAERRFHDHDLLGNFGARFRLNDHLRLLASVGHALSGEDTSDHWLSYLALQLLF
jgi:hypothetical protein